MQMGPDSKVFIPDGFATKIRARSRRGRRVVRGRAESADAVPRRRQPHAVHRDRDEVRSHGVPRRQLRPRARAGGSVTIKMGKQTAVVATGQAMVADASGIKPLGDDDKAESFGWLDKKMVVHQKPLRHVILVLGRFFNSDVKVPDVPLLDRPTSIDAPLDSAMLAIKQIEQSANVKFGYEGQNKVLRDASKSASKGWQPSPRRRRSSHRQRTLVTRRHDAAVRALDARGHDRGRTVWTTARRPCAPTRISPGRGRWIPRRAKGR